VDFLVEKPSSRRAGPDQQCSSPGGDVPGGDKAREWIGRSRMNRGFARPKFWWVGEALETMQARGVADLSLTSDAAEFVRFCYRRRNVGWPELYDEMCQVASRGAFRGWGPSELAEHGIGFSLFQTQALAHLVVRVLEAEGERVPRPVTLLARRTPHRDAEEDSAVERHRTLVRALGVA
jgi:hypothetical protein